MKIRAGEPGSDETFVILDGVHLVRDCIVADDAAGWADQYVRDVTGRLCATDWVPWVHRVTGQITIAMTAAAWAKRQAAEREQEAQDQPAASVP